MIALCAAVLLQQAAQDAAPRDGGPGPGAVVAVRVAHAPVLDGRLDDAAWTGATPLTGLIQQDPTEGAPASERTAVRIVYDADALYVGARMLDDDPGGIVSRLGRRDAVTHSDELRLMLDSYHDHRTAFEFDVDPAGVRRDAVVAGDGDFTDKSWDPVWEARTATDSLGWSVELRIPFSQLRFSSVREQVWGIRVVRWIARKHELAMFPFVRKTESGVASRFADLVGLGGLPEPRRLALLPYVVGRGDYQPVTPGNPFGDGSRYLRRGGADVQYGVSPGVTLDATVNPDFGQVEVDPAYVNLTAFEQFLDEHRPFFVEGSNIMEFGGNGGGLVTFKDPPLFFYSRRIGQPPQGSVTSPGQFVDMPANSTILGATKLSGKTPGGWSLDFLDAATRREFATVADTTTGLQSRDQVEPLTNYGVTRLKRDFRGGNTTLGLLATAVNRDLNDPALDGLRRQAYAGGVDLFQRWGHNTYTLAASLGGSYLAGDPAALQQAQRSSTRYFQRPGAQSFRVDTTRTTLAGFTGELYLNKVAGRWSWSLAGDFASPGFEINDLGYQQRVDRMEAAAAVRRRWTTPGKVFRQALVQLSHKRTWNYDGDAIGRNLGAYVYGQFHNFWDASINASYDLPVADDRLTRGGPLAAHPAEWFLSGALDTDTRRALVGYLFVSVGGDGAGGWSASVLPQLTLRPSAALSLAVGPYYDAARNPAQYVRRIPDTTATATAGARYVFAALETREVDATVRVDATVSPALSFQLYAQPFAYAGAYDAFGELAQPRSFQFVRYGQDNGSTIARSGDTYLVDPDGAGRAAPFTLANPDFRTRSLKVDAVLRWEYRPGSTLYLAWTQSRSGYVASDGTFGLGRNLADLLTDRPTNVVLLKISYWLSL